MPKAYSDDIKTQVKALIDQGQNDTHIKEKLNISNRTLHRWRSNLRRFNQMDFPMTSTPGRPRVLSRDAEEALYSFLTEAPDACYTDMQWFLYDFYGVIVDPRTVRRSFERRKWSRKALKAASIQKNDFARAEWLSRLKEYHADQLVFVDESAGNAVTGDMKKGFCEREAPAAEKKEAEDLPSKTEEQGEMVEDQVPVDAQLTDAPVPPHIPPPDGQAEIQDGQNGYVPEGQLPEGQLPLPTTLPVPPPLPVNMKRDARWSVLPAYTIGNGYLPGFMVVQGLVNEEMFSGWLRDQVLPHCTPFPGPRSVLIMDPAGIHQTQAVHDLCTAAGVRIEYLPPNSPDFNPVEQSLDDIKTGIKAHKAELPLHPDFGSYLHAVIGQDVAPGTKAKMHFKNACVVR